MWQISSPYRPITHNFIRHRRRQQQKQQHRKKKKTITITTALATDTLLWLPLQRNCNNNNNKNKKSVNNFFCLCVCACIWMPMLYQIKFIVCQVFYIQKIEMCGMGRKREPDSCLVDPMPNQIKSSSLCVLFILSIYLFIYLFLFVGWFGFCFLLFFCCSVCFFFPFSILRRGKQFLKY